MTTRNPFFGRTLEEYYADGFSTGRVLRSVGSASLEPSDHAFRQDQFIHNGPDIWVGPLYKTATGLVALCLEDAGATLPVSYFSDHSHELTDDLPLQQRMSFAIGLREAMKD